MSSFRFQMADGSWINVLIYFLYERKIASGSVRFFGCWGKWNVMVLLVLLVSLSEYKI